jgi:AhpD family alkylhydroperoxidase
MENRTNDLGVAKIEQSRADRKGLHKRFRANSTAYRHFLELEASVFTDGAIDRRTKELMALAVSIVTKCEPCIEWHVEQAVRTGATEKELHETIDVALEMGGGPAGAYARFALRAFDYYTAPDGPQPHRAEEDRRENDR